MMSPALAEVTLTANEIGVAAIAFVAMLLGYHFTISKYIRQQAGVKETQAMEVANQPIEVKAQLRFVQHEEMHQTLTGYATKEDLHNVSDDLSAKIEDNFRSLDGKRSASIGNLHEHLTGAKTALSKEIKDETMKVHDRVNGIADMVGKSVGKLEMLAKQMENLTTAMMERKGSR